MKFQLLQLIWLLVGLLLGLLASRILVISNISKAKREAQKQLEESKKEAETIKKMAKLEAKEKLYASKEEFDRQTRERRQELQHLEKRLLLKEENLERKADLIEAKEKDLTQKRQEVLKREAKANELQRNYEKILAEEEQQLERIAGLSSQEAKKLLLQRMEDEARREAVVIVKQIQDQARQVAERKAREIICLAIQRYSADQINESTVTVVDLPSEEMKGRIIGREGRNIRALEIATGVDLIIDDTPEAVILSGFDAVRREIAHQSLKRLVADGRIHPARIEEVVEKVTQEVENNIREAGEQVVFELGLNKFNPELIKLIGKLKYRTSYAQNVLQHSKEVAFIAGIMAAELGLDIKKAKRTGILHDIGKAVDHEVEGTHAQIGADIARRFEEDYEIIQAIEAHHDETETGSILAILIQAADTLSAARPGARREILESYIKRLEQLESIAQSFEGVEKAYAIQAGREVRIMVQQNNISDAEIIILAKKVAERVESEVEYPGQIKVTVIRETRAVEFAK